MLLDAVLTKAGTCGELHEARWVHSLGMVQNPGAGILGQEELDLTLQVGITAAGCVQECIPATGLAF
jgi:hypothetical protein